MPKIKDVKEWKDFGYANGCGKKTPERVTYCDDRHHKKETIVTGRCITKISCPICRYHYEIDSSG